MPRRLPWLSVLSLSVALVAASAGQGMAQQVRFSEPDPVQGSEAENDGVFLERLRRIQPPDGPLRSRTTLDEAPLFQNNPGSGRGRTGFLSANLGPHEARRPGDPARAPRNGVNGKRPAKQVKQPPQPIGPPRRVNRTRAPGSAAATAQAIANPSVNGAGNGNLATGSLGPRQAIAPAPIFAPPLRRNLVVEETPFDPLGVRVGAFLVRPAIEVSGGYDSNADKVPGGRGSAFGIVTPELDAKSDWVRHELLVSIRGSFTTYEVDPALDRPTFDARANGRVDVTHRDKILLEGRYSVATDYPNSPDLPAGVARLPLYSLVGASLGYAHTLNRLELTAKGAIERLDYADAELIDGSMFSGADRNYTQYSTLARASYDLLPGMKPFVEAILDTRIRDLEVDRSGLRRNSVGTQASVGTTFEYSPKLRGEISVGYLVRRYEDPLLQDLQGLVANAALIWDATPLTTAKLLARSTADESTLFGISGVLRRNVDLQVDHAFRRWLIASAKLGYGHDSFQGGDREDDRYYAALGMTYKMTRSVHVKAELRQEWLQSTVPGVDYTATIATLGMRLQR